MITVRQSSRKQKAKNKKASRLVGAQMRMACKSKFHVMLLVITKSLVGERSDRVTGYNPVGMGDVITNSVLTCPLALPHYYQEWHCL